MTSRDVDLLRAQLKAIVDAATMLSKHAEDLHGVAFERHVGDEAKVSRTGVIGVEATGDERARRLWRRLTVAARTLETTLRTLEWEASNLLSFGAGVEESRGSLVSKGEFKQAIRRQRQRRERGEYVPTRLVDQPPYPGTTAS